MTPKQITMFTSGQDTPLFSGTPQRVILDVFTEREPEPEQLPLPDSVTACNNPMTHYYAASSDKGLSFTYDSDCWIVHAFTTQAERDLFVKDNEGKAEAVTAKKAYQIAPQLRTLGPNLAWRCINHSKGL